MLKNQSTKIFLFTALLVVLLLVFRKKTKAMELDSGEVEFSGPFTQVNQSTQPETPNFKMSEFACNCGASVPKDYWGNLQILMNDLEVVRAKFGHKPITINSGYRTPEYNKQVGGASRSQHLTASAADFTIQGVHPTKVQEGCIELRAQGKITNGGIGRYNTFTHLDKRSGRADWDRR